MKFLRLGSSLKRAEDYFVEKQNFSLQVNVLTDMGVNSTNPSVSAIAFQSMSALHMSSSQEAPSQYQDILKVVKLRDISQPKNIHSAALLACVLANEREVDSKSRTATLDSLKAIVQCIIFVPDIKLSKVPAWHYDQFIGALECTSLEGMYTPEEQRQLVTTLIEKLPKSGDPTLQEDIIIRCLLLCRRNEAIVTPYPRFVVQRKDPAVSLSFKSVHPYFI